MRQCTGQCLVLRRRARFREHDVERDHLRTRGRASVNDLGHLRARQRKGPHLTDGRVIEVDEHDVVLRRGRRCIHQQVVAPSLEVRESVAGEQRHEDGHGRP